MTLIQQSNLEHILLLIYCFVDDFMKTILSNIRYALASPSQKRPPIKKHNVSIAELMALAIWRFFTGHRNWKDFYRHVQTYHLKDFPRLPTYQNCVDAWNRLAPLAYGLLNFFMKMFKNSTSLEMKKFVDSSPLSVCKIKREFSHKVARNIAKKSKGSMGWFYGFKLHVIANEMMQILNFRITAGNVDDRVAMEKMWNDIFGMIIADGGYVGKEWREKAWNLGKHLFTGVRANMKKLMSKAEHSLLKMRQKVEIVFSVLKLRMGLESTLSRSELGFFAHYLWCLTAYQLKKFFQFFSKNGSVEMLSA